jgi:rSAM/selenodomain-associated transferase 1
MPSAGPLVVVFARLPEPGRVKTRLARAIGDAAAAALYGALVEDLARRFAAAPWPVRWAIAPPAGDFARRFAIAPETCREQRGSDLGERMRGAFAAAFTDGFERVALIGSDAPELGPPHVASAFAALDDADVVFGPALDGGYTLVAMRQPHDVFAGIAWSTPGVLERSLERAAELGLRHALLGPAFDVDEASDLERLRGLVAAVPAEHSAVAAALARIRTR